MSAITEAVEVSTHRHGRPGLRIDFCGEISEVPADAPFFLGRDADLVIDDNPFLHRRLLRLARAEGIWLLSNVGNRLSVTVTDGEGRVQSWLSPGATVPIISESTTIVFTAGPTTYELKVLTDSAPYESLAEHERADDGSTTLGGVSLTVSQMQLVLALAEPLLHRDGTGMAEIPGSAAAAARLGWATTKFNRKLDNVCDKLSRIGVQGLRGEASALATNRRARLVEYAIGTRMVTRNDLPLLDAPEEES